MAKLDISNRLKNEPTYITIAEGKEYKVNKGYRTFVKLMDLMEQGDKNPNTNFFHEVFTLGLGEKATKEIEANDDYTSEDLETIVYAIFAGINGEDIDDVIARFQEAEKSEE